jgi:hypothetical protein
MRRKIQQTIFRAEPLRNIVGVTDVTAYQIVVSPASTLGHLGEVLVPAQAEICNDPDFGRVPAVGSRKFPPASWFVRWRAARR